MTNRSPKCLVSAEMIKQFQLQGPKGGVNNVVGFVDNYLKDIN